jgi:hypothetical protein
VASAAWEATSDFEVGEEVGVPALVTDEASVGDTEGSEPGLAFEQAVIAANTSAPVAQDFNPS